LKKVNREHPGILGAGNGPNALLDPAYPGRPRAGVLRYPVRERLMKWGIKFRPIRPGSPHLNGKVERSEGTDLDEFYSMVDLKDPELQLRLAEWKFYYNWYCPHSVLGGKTPDDGYLELIHQLLD
jgi:transposase InsO family protein